METQQQTTMMNFSKPVDSEAFETIIKPMRMRGCKIEKITGLLRREGYTNKSGSPIQKGTVSQLLIENGMRTNKERVSRKPQEVTPKAKVTHDKLVSQVLACGTLDKDKKLKILAILLD